MKQFIELSEAEFNLFSTHHPKENYLQTVEMAHLLKIRGWKVNYVGLKNDEQIIAAAMLSGLPIKFGYYYNIAGGPLMDYENQEEVEFFINGLKKYTKERKGLYLNFTPNLVYQYRDSDGNAIGQPDHKIHNTLMACGLQHDGFKTGYANENPRIVYTKDLTNITTKELTKTYNRSTRKKVNKTAKSGIKLRELSRDELPFFENVMHHTADRQDFHDKDLAYYETLYDSFNGKAHFMVTELNFFTYAKDIHEKIEKLNKKIEQLKDIPAKENQRENAKVELNALEVRLEEIKDIMKEDIEEEEILAAGLFIENAREMLFLFGGMYDRYKNFLSPSYYLQHAMMEKTIEKGLSRYNFYGISGIYDGSDGVLNFKKGFEGIVEEQVGTYTLVVNTQKYQLYRMLKNLVAKTG